MWHNIRAWRSNGERWNDPVRTRKFDGAQESTRTVPRAHPAVSRFAVVVQLFRLLFLHRLSAKINALLLKMSHTTACVFVAVVKIFSFLHINSDIIHRGVPDLLVHTVSLNITFHSKGTLWYDLFSLHVITTLREDDLLCLPIDSLWWQLVERQCQRPNIRMYLCVNWRKIRKFTPCILNFGAELEWRILRAPTVLHDMIQIRHKQWCLKIGAFIRRMFFFRIVVLFLLTSTRNNAWVSFLVLHTSTTVLWYRILPLQSCGTAYLCYSLAVLLSVCTIFSPCICSLRLSVGSYLLSDDC